MEVNSNHVCDFNGPSLVIFGSQQYDINMYKITKCLQMKIRPLTPSQIVNSIWFDRLQKYKHLKKNI